MSSARVGPMKRGRKRQTASSCTVCGYPFPSPTTYNPSDYEKLLLDHMMTCSATSETLSARPRPSSRKRPMKKAQRTITNESKPAAVVVPACTATMSPVRIDDANGRQREDERPPPGSGTNCLSSFQNAVSGVFDSTKAVAPCTKHVSQNEAASIVGGAISSSSPKQIPINPVPLHHKKKSSLLQHSDTASTASTTKESSTNVSVVSSSHFLAQTWWRDKTIRRNSGLSVPFSLESCVAVVSNRNDKEQPKVDTTAGDNIEAAAASGREVRRRRTRSRPKNETLQLNCPICRKPFRGFIAMLTEDAMSRHVDRCSRKFLSEVVPASRKVQGAPSENETSKMDDDLAVVAALSRPRHAAQGTGRAQIQDAESDRRARDAAKVTKRRATMTFLTHGYGKQALDTIVLRNGQL